MMAHSFRTQIAVLWCCCAALAGNVRFRFAVLFVLTAVDNNCIA